MTEPIFVQPEAIAWCVARAMEDYDRMIADEPDLLMRMLMTRDRGKIEALIRERARQELAKAALDLVEPEEETQQ